MAEKRKQEKLGRRIKNWALDRDYVFLCLFFVVILGGAATYLVLQEKKTPSVITTGDLVFSKDNGFYSESLDVEIFPKKDGEIRFNLNGDDINNNSEEYDGAVRLVVPDEGYKVYTLGAALCDEKEGCGEVERKTYVLGRNINQDVDLDIISITSSQHSLYDYESGILTGGKIWEENHSKNPGSGYTAGNYSERGEEWIRPAHVAGFDTNGNLLLDADLGLAVSGGSSDQMAVKSLKLVGNKKYGYTKIPLEGDSYNSVRLRNGSQDMLTGNIRSALVGRMVEQVGFDGGTITKRAVVFLNGEFYAITDIQQSYSNSFLTKKYHLPQADSVEKCKGGERYCLTDFNVRSLFDEDLNSKENRRCLEEKVDMDSYLMYYALEILWNNTDWPNNGFEIWRYVGEISNENIYTDGRVRFLIYDTDLIYYRDGNTAFFPGAIGDTLAYLMENQYHATGSTFRNVMKSDYYRVKFLDIMRQFINDTFTTEKILSIFDEEKNKISKQMSLFYSQEENEEWEKAIARTRQAIAERDETIRNDVKKYFGVSL